MTPRKSVGTTEEELERTNPYFNSGDRNYADNCQMCVFVYPMRMVGYDIEALPYNEKNQYMVHLAMNPELAFIDSETNEPPKPSLIYDKKQWKDRLEAINSFVKEGQMWVMMFTWSRQSDLGGSHVVCVTNKNGKLHIIDPQRGRITSDDDLVRMYVGLFDYDEGMPIRIFRIDDKLFNTDLIEMIYKR